VKLSVIIPCLNAAPTIGAQLEALARQSWLGPWEVVVCDNGSEDGSLEIVRSYRRHLPELRIVDASDALGPAHARNVGVRESAGEVIVYCDADDEVAEAWLAAMAQALNRHEFVAGRLEWERLNDRWAADVRGQVQVDSLMNSELGPPFTYGFACTLGVRRRLHEAVGGFDEGFRRAAGDDMDYCWRLQAAGAELHFVPEAVTFYRCRHTLLGIYRQARDYGAAEVVVYKKHLPLGLPAIARPWLTGSRRWAGVARQLLRMRNKKELGLFLWRLGLSAGRLRASVKQRMVML
jgi:glycosyltransferase involved in cell wall biosynthesis